VTTTDDFDVRVTTMPSGATVLSVSGDLDLATAPELERVLGETEPPTHLVVDLTGCGFLDSSGMRVLVGARRAGHEARIDIVASDAGIVRALEIARLDTMFRVHSSLDRALAD
jgi:anti-anti-sigma factor